jgi:hypothetical protein
MSIHRQNPSTAIAFDDSDTIAIDFRLGARVRCILGDLKGLEGAVAATRTGGRLLVRVAKGVLIEVPRICLRTAQSDP